MIPIDLALFMFVELRSIWVSKGVTSLAAHFESGRSLLEVAHLLNDSSLVLAAVGNLAGVASSGGSITHAG